MNKKSLLQKAVAAPHVMWAVLFIIAPLFFVVYYAFTDKDGNFTFDNIAELAQASYLEIFLRSLCFAFLATVICLIIAYPIAYFMTKASPKTQKILIMLVMLPQWLNFLIRTYSWMALLEDTGIINNLITAVGLDPVHMINTSGAVILGMVYNYLPYMIIPLHSVMSKIDSRLLEAASDLGCSHFKVITRVVFPLSMAGIISGVTMVFVPSISTFYISQKLGGGNFDLIGDTIERQFQTAYNYNLGASMSFVLMIIIMISMAVMSKYSGEDDGGVIV
ncbi:MAG: ABC transporter permease [Clostridia bacterium]|nr:ABC transporter permease [Clostridia bacterium]MBO5440324.1 ABC transporter permease [Clostridia bacterium]